MGRRAPDAVIDHELLRAGAAATTPPDSSCSAVASTASIGSSRPSDRNRVNSQPARAAGGAIAASRSWRSSYTSGRRYDGADLAEGTARRARRLLRSRAARRGPRARRAVKRATVSNSAIAGRGGRARGGRVARRRRELCDRRSDDYTTATGCTHSSAARHTTANRSCTFSSSGCAYQVFSNICGGRFRSHVTAVSGSIGAR